MARNSSKCTCYSDNLRGKNHKKYCFGTNERWTFEKEIMFNFTMCDFYYTAIVRVLRALLYYGIWLVFQFDIIYIFFSLSPLLTSFLSYDRKEWPCQERIYLIRILNLKVLICCSRCLLQSRFKKFLLDFRLCIYSRPCKIKSTATYHHLRRCSLTQLCVLVLLCAVVVIVVVVLFLCMQTCVIIFIIFFYRNNLHTITHSHLFAYTIKTDSSLLEFQKVLNMFIFGVLFFLNSLPTHTFKM